MKGKVIVFIIGALSLIIVGIILLTFKDKPLEDNLYDIELDTIVRKLDNKESFNLYLYSQKDNSDLLKVLNYYNDVLSIKFDKLEMKTSNEKYKSLMNRLNEDGSLTSSDEHAFLVITDGTVDYSLNGSFTENALKKLLIKSNKIGVEYKSIDYLVNDTDFKDYYNTDEILNILFINRSNDKLFKYRKILCKNKVNSVVVYTGDLDSVEIIDMFRDKIGDVDESTEKLPILVKIKNKEIITTKYKISLDDFASEIK